MDDAFTPAIVALERRLEAAERKVNDIRRTINILCEEAGMPPRYPDGGGGGAPTASVMQITDDTFYGKKQQTAIREYLEMRKSQGLGPAMPREIFEALKGGGYQFEAKDDTTALISLRALLRKRTNFFHKLPTGAYGLTNWYEHTRKAKNTSSSDDPGDDNETLDDDNEEKKAATVTKTAAAS